MAIKLIVTDMDGTLFDDDHVTVPPRNIAALRRARERGIKLALASGRTWSILRDAAEQLGGVDYAILSNGAAIRDCATGEHIYENGIPNPQAVALIRGLCREDLPFEVYCRGKNYLRTADTDRLEDALLSPGFAEVYLKRGVVLVPDLADALAGRPMEKINLFHAPSERREALREMALATGPVEISNALEGNMEFNYGGVSKGAALAALAARLGFVPEEVMAFGDAGNDLTMLSWAGLSFAMANATQAAKAAAKRQTASNREAGVGQAVEKYILDQE